MKVIYATGSPKLHLKPTSAAIGIFDGVHKGHQYLINHMLKTCKRLKTQSMVITFFPHPAHILKPSLDLSYLTTLERRLKLIEDMGVDICVVIDFNKRFAGIDPKKFVEETLVKSLNVRAIFVGEDFRFGKNRSGDIALFKEMGNQLGFEVHAMKPLSLGGSVISSTRIREAIREGKLPLAQKLLGHDVSIEGTVVQGAGRGRTLGFPTANIAPKTPLMLPFGVYAVRIYLKSKALNAVANIGIRPSFKEKKPSVHLEVYIFDFKKDIYNAQVHIEFIQKIRNEKAFKSPEELVAQIHTDVLKARRILQSRI